MSESRYERFLDGMITVLGMLVPGMAVAAALIVFLTII